MADNLSRALTDALVRNAKPASKPQKLADGGGLFLLVQPNGAKLWRYKFRHHGRESLQAFGAYPDVSLAAARAEHRKARELLAAGINPVLARQQDRRNAERDRLQAAVGSFEAVLDSWRAATDPALAVLTIRQRQREIPKHLTPAFRGRQVSSITRGEIAALLKRVDAATPEVARNLRNYLGGMFEHAAGLGLIDANPVPPARIMQRRAPVSHAAMREAKLPAFLKALEGSGANQETKAAMLLVILTASRKTEVTGARWSEFDLDAGEWTVPAERMKGRREHWVGLPVQAVRLLLDLRQQSAGLFLFPHRDKPDQPMAGGTLNMLLRRIGYHGETVHGFRSVFSTHFNEAGANPDVIERCLAHTPADKVRAAYNRHLYKAERRQMLQQWADFIDGQRA